MSDLTRLLKTSSEDDPKSLQLLCKELMRRGFHKENSDIFDPYPHLGGVIKGFALNYKIVHLVKVEESGESPFNGEPYTFNRSFCGYNTDYTVDDVEHLNTICKACIRNVKKKLAEVS